MKYTLLALALSLATGAANASAQPPSSTVLLQALQQQDGVTPTLINQSIPTHTKAGTLLVAYESRLDTLENGPTLLARVQAGASALVFLDAPPDRGKGLGTLLGMRPDVPFLVLTSDGKGGLTTHVLNLADAKTTAAAIGSLVKAQARRVAASKLPTPRSSGGDSGEVLAPQLRQNLNWVSDDGKVQSSVTLTVVRNVDRANDVKTILVKTRTSLHPDQAITDGNKTGQNLWMSRLPTRYTFGHKLEAKGLKPVLVDFLPESDGSTEFDYSKTHEKSFNIAGSLGGQFGGGSTPEQKHTWTAQSPFSANASYTLGTKEQLSHRFKDYALLVTRQVPDVRWEAPLDGRIGQHTLVRPTSRLPVFQPENLKPMMRIASMDALSEWVVPGSYEDNVTVTLSGGFTSHVDRWWWERSRVVSREENATVEATHKIDLNMGHWSLAREIPVLLRSFSGEGKCISAAGSRNIELQTCDSNDSRQMWGFDEARRYRNMATKQCMTFNVSNKRVEQAACALTNNQAWEWRAERLHSLYNPLWRLYTSASSRYVKLEPDGAVRVQNLPLNQFNALNKPWSSYPDAPSKNDTMPNLNGASPQISPDWVGKFGPVSAEQRWQTLVISRALKE